MNKYECECGTKHTIPAYAHAQSAMGHSVNHQCICGRTNIYLSHGRGVLIGALPACIHRAEVHLEQGQEVKMWGELFKAAKRDQLPVRAHMLEMPCGRM